MLFFAGVGPDTGPDDPRTMAVYYDLTALKHQGLVQNLGRGF